MLMLLSWVEAMMPWMLWLSGLLGGGCKLFFVPREAVLERLEPHDCFGVWRHCTVSTLLCILLTKRKNPPVPHEAHRCTNPFPLTRTPSSCVSCKR